MGSDSSEPETKEASSNTKKFMQSASMLEKLAAMNATKTELRHKVVYYKVCACDHREGPVTIQQQVL